LRLPETTPLEVEEKDAAFVLGTYARAPFHPRKGKGAKLWDAEGKEYWDLLGGIAVSALGHAHPRLVRALKEAAGGLLHTSNLYHQPGQALLAERLVTASGLSKAFFCNSGTEAMEAALKFARLATPGRWGVVALEEGFHGRTMGAVSITGHEAYRTPFDPMVPGASFVPPNDVPALRSAVAAAVSAASGLSAIVLEPVLGEGGVIPLTKDFVLAAREEADRAGAVLVLDEIQCGLGRTGSLFAFQALGVVPDMVTLAKPLGGGLPLGALLVGERIVPLVKPGMHGTTFGGNPVACRLGLEFLCEIEEKGLVARVAATGVWFGRLLRNLKRRCPAVVDVRGSGLIWGIELDREAKPVVTALRERGFVVGTSREKVIRLLPPFVTPKPALASFAAALEAILKEEQK